MKFKSTKRKIIVVAVILLIISLLLNSFALIFINSNVAFAESESVTALSEQPDLNSDNVACSNLTIRDYPDKLIATKAAVRKTDGKAELNGLEEDDPIVHIVPKEHFFKVGQVLDMGDEYGYFINTKKTLYENYSSTVLVFDITTITDLVGYDDRVIVEVSPIFQYKFVGLTNSASEERFQGSLLSYGILDEPCVVAYPSSLFSFDDVKYEMVEEYYLKDVSFGASLYNEQALNYGDSGYDPYNDYGSYFTGFDYSYKGKYREYGEFNGADLAWNLADTAFMFLGFCNKVPLAKEVSQIYSVISCVKGWIEFAIDTYDALAGHIEIAEKRLTATCLYNNRDDQLKYYRDKNGNPVLAKTASIITDTYSEQSIWYGVGNNVAAYFGVGHSALDGRTPNCTRFINQLALKIVNSKDDQTVIAGYTVIEDSLREPEIKNIKGFETDSVYMLYEGEDHFLYENIKYESDYTVNVNLTDNATVNVNGEIKCGKDLTFTVNAKERSDIKIDLSKNEFTLKGNINISPNETTTIKSISANARYMIKADLEGVKNLKTNNPNLIIENVFTNADGNLVPYESYITFNKGASLAYPFDCGQAYYVVIRNESVEVINNATIEISDVQNFVPEQHITASADVKAMSFVNTYNSSISFQLKLPQLGGVNAVSVYNENGLSISYATVMEDGVIKYSFALAAGEKCYIYYSLSTEVAFSVLADEKYVKWEIDGNIYDLDYNISLPRGREYTVHLYYFKDNYGERLSTAYNIDSKPNYFTFSNNVLNITYNVPYTYVITIVPISYPDATLRITPTQGREDIDYTVTFNKTGGKGGSDSVLANYNHPMPNAEKPYRTGYTFQGYYSENDGNGTKYYDSQMNSDIIWLEETNITLYAYWKPNTYNVYFYQHGGSGGSTVTKVTYGEKMTMITLPTCVGKSFRGYYLSTSGGACYYEYYDSEVTTEEQYYGYIAKNCDFDAKDGTLLYLHALWDDMTWNVWVNSYLNNKGYVFFPDIIETSINLTYNQQYIFDVPRVLDYELDRWELTYHKGIFATGKNTKVELTNLSQANYDRYTLTVYYDYKPNRYTAHGMEVVILNKIDSTWKLRLTNYTGENRVFEYNSKMCFENHAGSWSGLDDVNSTDVIRPGYSTTISISENAMANSIAISYKDGVYRKIFYAKHLDPNLHTMSAMGNVIDTTQSQECVAAGTLITLADGSQKAVEELTGNEMLLVWNMKTGTFDSAPILFIDSDPLRTYDIINLHFSDETSVKVISEHGFWDFDLNRYVYLDENAEDYIGHWFYKQTLDAAGNYAWEKVQLTEVTFTQEYTTAWSPVTYGHLCYFVDGMLSMPGGIDGLFNIFEVDGETLTYNAEAMASDVEEYGLFTYEEFYEIYPISEEVFEAFNGEYLKVAIGKGLITYERIGELIERYAEFF